MYMYMYTHIYIYICMYIYIYPISLQPKMLLIPPGLAMVLPGLLQCAAVLQPRSIQRGQALPEAGGFNVEPGEKLVVEP